MVYPVSDGFTAECIDLDLIAKAPTAHKAFESLKTAITGYLDVAISGDVEGLIPRPSPRSHRLRYHYYAAMAAILSGKREFCVTDYPVGPGYCHAG